MTTVQANLIGSPFPIVSDRYQMTEDWALTLPLQFQRRFEDQDLVLWRPGFTMWINIWGASGETPQARCTRVRETADPNAFDAKVVDHRETLWLSYRLNEPDEERGTRFALYGFAFGVSGDVNIAFYFDDESDLEIARTIWLSVNETETQ
jgi:hypothetical protein